MTVNELRTGLSHGESSEGRKLWGVDALHQVSYQVVTSDSLFSLQNSTLANHGTTPAAAAGSRRLVVIDETVDELFGALVREYFSAHGVHASFLRLRATEVSKDWASVQQVVEAVNEFGLDRRNEPIVAIGGGVLLDVVGFAASTYRRGTPYIRIPTTLIGLVDAGVGVKTGINFGGSKNRIGSYAPPLVSYVDRTFLSSLEQRHVSNGLAEILKMALIKSSSLFELLEEHASELLSSKLAEDGTALGDASRAVIDSAIQLMLEELQPNLWETNLERCVDYGHTFSPTIEMRALPELLHGEAVCIDMALTTVLSARRGTVSENEMNRVLHVMALLGLPLWTDVLETRGILSRALEETVNHRGGKQRIPLPIGIGHHYFANDVTPGELDSGLSGLRALAQSRTLVSKP